MKLNRHRIRRAIHDSSPLVACGYYGAALTAAIGRMHWLIWLTLTAAGILAHAYSVTTPRTPDTPAPDTPALSLVAAENPNPGDGRPDILVAVECRIEPAQGANILRGAAERLGTLHVPPNTNTSTNPSGGSVADHQA